MILKTEIGSEMDDFKAITTTGPVRGVLENGSIVFKGIPYAEPPVEHLRFAAPRKHSVWKKELLCNSWPPDEYCFSPFENTSDGHIKSEDCLYLNIWIPALREELKPLPVMFYLYGSCGSSHDKYIDGHEINKHGCILISINYRTDLFGFFGLDELAAEDEDGSTGNYGLMDILFALNWVRDNIRSFGGDPNNVTVFGHSAGAIYTKWLLGIKSARGLFRRVISLSGGGIWDIDYVHSFESKCALCRQMLEMVGWTRKDLYKKSTKEVYGTLKNLEKQLNLPKTSMLNTLFLPSVDGRYVTDYFGKILYDGDVATDVDVMCGMISEEWHNFPCQITGGIEGFEREFALAPVIAWGERYCQRGFRPVYNYFFERHIPGGERWMKHSDELPYVFGTMNRFFLPWTEADYELKDAVVSYYTNFAKNGNPNSEGLPIWRPYTAGNPVTMHFTDDYFACESVMGNEKTRQAVDYLLDNPGLPERPFKK